MLSLPLNKAKYFMKFIYILYYRENPFTIDVPTSIIRCSKLTPFILSISFDAASFPIKYWFVFTVVSLFSNKSVTLALPIPATPNCFGTFILFLIAHLDFLKSSLEPIQGFHYSLV